jgi:hypothetical protein
MAPAKFRLEEGEGSNGSQKIGLELDEIRKKREERKK